MAGSKSCSGCQGSARIRAKSTDLGRAKFGPMQDKFGQPSASSEQSVHFWQKLRLSFGPPWPNLTEIWLVRNSTKQKKRSNLGQVFRCRSNLGKVVRMPVESGPSLNSRSHCSTTIGPKKHTSTITLLVWTSWIPEMRADLLKQTPLWAFHAPTNCPANARTLYLEVSSVTTRKAEWAPRHATCVRKQAWRA